MKREVVFKNSHLGRRAIVVGAGLGGLSAARVLSDYFDEVIILDRDELPVDAIPRPWRSPDTDAGDRFLTSQEDILIRSREEKGRRRKGEGG